jgi:hypothetical protein
MDYIHVKMSYAHQHAAVLRLVSIAAKPQLN